MGLGTSLDKGSPRCQASSEIDESRLWGHLMELAQCGATPQGGVNRQAFSGVGRSACACRQMG